MTAHLFEDMPTELQREESQRRRDHLTFRGNVRQGRHGWLRLTPAYSRHVAREILKVKMGTFYFFQAVVACREK